MSKSTQEYIITSLYFKIMLLHSKKKKPFKFAYVNSLVIKDYSVYIYSLTKLILLVRINFVCKNILS